jgi:fermentation-respiration switch protein FrsA (DUF1100 family)
VSSIELAFEGEVAMATMGELARPARPAVRLTRRGRLVLLAVLLVLVGGLAVVIAPASDAAGPPTPPRTVVVHRGDTLWSIAARYVPGGDPFATIEEIRRLNGIDDYTVFVGESLVLPRPHR